MRKGTLKRQVRCNVGLNIFYSEEKDWARHTTRQCPLQRCNVVTVRATPLGAGFVDIFIGLLNSGQVSLLQTQ